MYYDDAPPVRKRGAKKKAANGSSEAGAPGDTSAGSSSTSFTKKINTTP